MIWLLLIPVIIYLTFQNMIRRCYICQTQGLPVVLGDSGDVS